MRPLAGEQGGQQKFSPQGDAINKEAAAFMEPRRIFRRADGKGAAKKRTAEDQHDDPGEVAQDRQRKCAEKDDPLLPKFRHKEIAKKRREHEKREK